jgi:hypothetical protein
LNRNYLLKHFVEGHTERNVEGTAKGKRTLEYVLVELQKGKK